jgi:hypothetical protein
VKAGMMPPEVDITSPVLYEPIYADRVAGTVPVFGRVAANRRFGEHGEFHAKGVFTKISDIGIGFGLL